MMQTLQLPEKSYTNVASVKRALKPFINDLRDKGELVLPSERILSDRFECSRKTLRHAFDQLEDEGVLVKAARQRMIADNTGAGKSQYQTKKQIVVIAPVDDSIHDPTVNCFFRQLSNNDEILVHVIDSMSNPQEAYDRVESLIAQGAKHIFVVANSKKLQCLETLNDRAVFYRLKADDLMTELDTPGIFIDYYYGGYIGMKHLIETGCVNNLVVSVKPEHKTRVFRDFERGCRDAAQDSELEVNLDFFHKTKARDFSTVLNSQYLTEKILPFDAVFAFQDYELVKLHNLLLIGGYSIPNDLSLLGFKNSPWATFLHPQLSSISTRDDLIVERALEMMQQDRNSLEVIKPKLVLRESTRQL